MDDIVQQLRTAPDRLSNIGANAERLILAAADEIERLRGLIAKLSADLTDEGASYSDVGLDMVRQEVADALPGDACPDWLKRFTSAS